MNFFIALFKSITSIFSFGEKAIPPDEIRIDKHEEKKPLREQDNNQDLLTDDFRYCKKRVEIDMWDFVRNTHPTMEIEALVRHHKMLVARVTEYRKDVVNRKGLKWKKYEVWLSENEQVTKTTT